MRSEAGNLHTHRLEETIRKGTALAREGPLFFCYIPFSMTTFHIPKDWPVLVVEDSPARTAWFRERMPRAVFVSTVEDALEILETSTFRAVFLDHDLNFRDAAFPEQIGSGQRIANYLAGKGCEAVIVIHSVNELGARRMKALLHHAHVAPFGTFEIEE